MFPLIFWREISNASININIFSRFYLTADADDDLDGDQVQRQTLFCLPREVHEKYYIGKRLGCGSGGVVYSAFKRMLDGNFSDEKVALKIIQKGMKSSFRHINEAKLLEGKISDCLKF